MKDIATKLNQILTIKNAIKEALNGISALKSTDTFEDYASIISSLYVK